jgi:hypothetical protein
VKQERADVIVVKDREIPVVAGKVDIFELKYYDDNPRIFSIVTSLPKPVTQSMIEEKLWEVDYVRELFQTIKRDGGLVEPILLRGDEVIEGNCRLRCYRQLYQRAAEHEKGKWREVPSRALPKETTDEEVASILGTLHIHGKQRWDPFETAGYIWSQTYKLNKTPEELAEVFTMTKAEVERSIDVYQLMKDCKVIETKKFSYFDEYFKSATLVKLVKKDDSLEKRIVDWVMEGRIPRAEDMRELGHILEDSKIAPKFRSGQLDFEEALQATNDRHPEHESTFYNRLEKAKKWLDKAPIAEIKQEIAADPHKRTKIKYFLKSVRDFAMNLDLDQKS